MPPPQPLTLDPNSPMARRLLERDARLATPQGRADAMPDIGGMDTADPRFQQLLSRQVADLGAPPPGLLPAGPAAPAAPTPEPAGGPNPFRDGTGAASPLPTPATLAAGNTAIAPVPTADPFRVLPMRQSADRTLSDGSILPGDFFGPGAAGMTREGFQPGLMMSGAGQTMANNPADYLIAMQRNAGLAGVSPTFTAEQFLGTMNGTNDRAQRAGIAAQQQNANLASGRMQADASRDTARIGAEGSARTAAFGAIPGFVQALGTGAMPPGVADLIGGYIGRGVQGGQMGGPGTSPPPSGGPMGPGGPAGPGASPAANPFAAVAAGAEFAAPLRSIFGQRNAQGVFTPAAGLNLNAAIPQLLDRFQTGTPGQRAALVQMAERGELGNFDDISRAVGTHGAVSTLRANGGLAPGQSGIGNILGNGSLAGIIAKANPFTGPSIIPANSRGSFAVGGSPGQPVMTFSEDPNQSVGSAAVGRFMSGGVGANRAVVPGFSPFMFDRTQISSPFNRPGSSAEDDRRRGQAALDFLQQTERYRAATRGGR